MLNRLLALELGNNEGLRSSKNIKKLLYMYIIPNISAITLAIAIGTQRFYDPKQMLIFLLNINLFIIIIIQYSAQRGLFRKLDKEALLKLMPTKISAFIKMRLFFLMAKFYFPILLFSIVLTGHFIQDQRFVYILLACLLIILIIPTQIYLAMIIRYYTNTIKKSSLQVLQVILFLAFVGYLCFFMMTSIVGFILPVSEDYLNAVGYPILNINLFPIFIILLIIALISIVLFSITKRIHIKLLIHNRNLSFNLPTAKLERLHEAIYGFGMSHTQKLLFRKDIQYMFRNSKVMIALIGLVHIINLSMLIFLFLDLPGMIEDKLFISKFYLAVVFVLIFGMGILSTSFKDSLDLDNDFNVLKSYHIELSKQELITTKTRVLRAFVFPKLTLMYTILIMTMLILTQFTVALMLLFNYFQCFLCLKTFELIRVKTVNQMNSESSIMHGINFLLILLTINMFFHLLHSSIENAVLYQILFLGSLIILYCFHVFIFKNKKFTEGVISHAGS